MTDPLVRPCSLLSLTLATALISTLTSATAPLPSSSPLGTWPRSGEPQPSGWSQGGGTADRSTASTTSHSTV